MTVALAAGLLAAAGVWLITALRGVKLIIGFVLLGHAANLALIAAGGTSSRTAPLADQGLDLTTAADPLPQAFVLTAIVITFGVTVYLLSLIWRTEGPDEETA